jgi:hypothetical protein
MNAYFLDQNGQPDPDKIAAHLASLPEEDAKTFVGYLIAEVNSRPERMSAEDLRNLEFARALRQLPVEEIKDLLAIQGGGSFSRQVTTQTKRAIAAGTSNLLLSLGTAFLGILFILFLYACGLVGHG